MNHYTVRLKLKAAQSDLRAIGITLRKVENEYQVYPKGETSKAYFTNDIEDAVATGRAMVNTPEPAASVQGVCKDCGNGTLNNELVPAFEFDDATYTVSCLRCNSSHVDIVAF